MGCSSQWVRHAERFLDLPLDIRLAIAYNYAQAIKTLEEAAAAVEIAENEVLDILRKAQRTALARSLNNGRSKQ